MDIDKLYENVEDESVPTIDSEDDLMAYIASLRKEFIKNECCGFEYCTCEKKEKI